MLLTLLTKFMYMANKEKDYYTKILKEEFFSLSKTKQQKIDDDISIEILNDRIVRTFDQIIKYLRHLEKEEAGKGHKALQEIGLPENILIYAILLIENTELEYVVNLKKQE